MILFKVRRRNGAHLLLMAIIFDTILICFNFEGGKNIVRCAPYGNDMLGQPEISTRKCLNQENSKEKLNTSFQSYSYLEVNTLLGLNYPSNFTAKSHGATVVPYISKVPGTDADICLEVATLEEEQTAPKENEGFEDILQEQNGITVDRMTEHSFMNPVNSWSIILEEPDDSGNYCTQMKSFSSLEDVALLTAEKHLNMYQHTDYSKEPSESRINFAYDMLEDDSKVLNPLREVTSSRYFMILKDLLILQPNFAIENYPSKCNLSDPRNEKVVRTCNCCSENESGFLLYRALTYLHADTVENAINDSLLDLGNKFLLLSDFLAISEVIYDLLYVDSSLVSAIEDDWYYGNGKHLYEYFDNFTFSEEQLLDFVAFNETRVNLLLHWYSEEDFFMFPPSTGLHCVVGPKSVINELINGPKWEERTLEFVLDYFRTYAQNTTFLHDMGKDAAYTSFKRLDENTAESFLFTTLQYRTSWAMLASHSRERTGEFPLKNYFPQESFVKSRELSFPITCGTAYKGWHTLDFLPYREYASESAELRAARIVAEYSPYIECTYAELANLKAASNLPLPFMGGEFLTLLLITKETMDAFDSSDLDLYISMLPTHYLVRYFLINSHGCIAWVSECLQHSDILQTFAEFTAEEKEYFCTNMRFLSYEAHSYYSADLQLRNEWADMRWYIEELRDIHTSYMGNTEVRVQQEECLLGQSSFIQYMHHWNNLFSPTWMNETPKLVDRSFFSWLTRKIYSRNTLAVNKRYFSAPLMNHFGQLIENVPMVNLDYSVPMFYWNMDGIEKKFPFVTRSWFQNFVHSAFLHPHILVSSKSSADLMYILDGDASYSSRLTAVAYIIRSYANCRASQLDKDNICYPLAWKWCTPDEEWFRKEFSLYLAKKLPSNKQYELFKIATKYYLKFKIPQEKHCCFYKMLSSDAVLKLLYLIGKKDVLEAIDTYIKSLKANEKELAIADFTSILTKHDKMTVLKLGYDRLVNDKDSAAFYQNEIISNLFTGSPFASYSNNGVKFCIPTKSNIRPADLSLRLNVFNLKRDPETRKLQFGNLTPDSVQAGSALIDVPELKASGYFCKPITFKTAFNDKPMVFTSLEYHNRNFENGELPLTVYAENVSNRGFLACCSVPYKYGGTVGVWSISGKPRISYAAIEKTPNKARPQNFKNNFSKSVPFWLKPKQISTSNLSVITTRYHGLKASLISFQALQFLKQETLSLMKRFSTENINLELVDAIIGVETLDVIFKLSTMETSSCLASLALFENLTWQLLTCTNSQKPFPYYQLYSASGESSVLAYGINSIKTCDCKKLMLEEIKKFSAVCETNMYSLDHSFAFSTTSDWYLDLLKLSSFNESNDLSYFLRHMETKDFAAFPKLAIYVDFPSSHNFASYDY